MMLLVTDARETADRIDAALDRRVRRVRTLPGARNALADEHPDAVLLDWSLSDGTIRALLSDVHGERDDRTPVVALVGQQSEDAVRDPDCDEVVSKPVEPGAIRDAVERVALVADYNDAVDELFALCRERARADATEQSPDSTDLLGARNEADRRLHSLRRIDDDAIFQSVLQ